MAIDFFFDEEFIHFVNGDLPVPDAGYWDGLAADDRVAREMQIARFWIGCLVRKEVEERAAVREEVWRAVIGRTKARRGSKVLALGWVRLAAACCIGILAVTAGYFITDRVKHVRVETAYGKREYIALPDSSGIELFGHSSVKYGRQWAKGPGREIWLVKGNAQFSVRHGSVGVKGTVAEPFRVHYDHYTITVLGTRFFVSARSTTFSVELFEGKVQIADDDAPGNVRVLHPGERFEVNTKKHDVFSYPGPSSLRQEWEKQELSLDGKSVADVVDYIEEVFGYEIHCDTPEILNIKLNGKLPAQNLDLILLAIGKMTNTDIRKSNTTITIHSKD